mmetsp:Transcript_806/g.2740  ORF Transcript_806/g.2740 Transcript_806/m.2740 type:complete len:231 (+) Transcript_806:375-1067(+)
MRRKVLSMAGPRKRICSAIFSHPRRFSAVLSREGSALSSAGAPASSSTYADSTSSSSGTIAGGSCGTYTTQSVTMSDLEGLWKKTISLAGPTPMTGGEKSFWSISAAHSASGSPSRRTVSDAKGMLMGQLHCPGTAWTLAPGKALLKGLTKSLCSSAVVGSTMCFTSPPTSLRSLTHSSVGAMGAWTQRSPDWRRTTTMRVWIVTLKNPWGCSKRYTSSLICVRMVRRSK